MKKNIFGKKLQRVIGQVRYRPTVASFSNTSILAAKLEKSFEEWRALKHDDISLYSPSEKKILRITSDSITYLNEKEESTKELFQYINELFNKSVKSLSINKIKRIGVRNSQVLECPFKYEELVDLIYRKFYLQNEKLKKISVDKPKDTVFILDGVKNNFLNHVQIGPVNKEDGVKYFNSNFEIEKDTLKSTNLFVDIDVFIGEGLNKQNAMNKLNEAIKENLRLVNLYIEYLNQ